MTNVPRVGRPRDPGLDDAILEATRELMAEVGYGGLTIREVARRAGVGVPTVYRRWENKGLLVFHALFEQTETAELPDTGDVAGDLRQVIQVAADEMSSPAAAMGLMGLMADFGTDAELGERIRSGIIKPGAERLSAVLHRAAERGEIDVRVDHRFVIEAIAGIVYLRAAVLAEPIGPAEVEQILNLILRGIGPNQPSPKGAT